jgi:rRNA processing protein Krr1/Pno1
MPQVKRPIPNLKVYTAMDKIEAVVNVVTVLITTHPYLFTAAAVIVAAIGLSCKYVFGPAAVILAKARYAKP